MSYLEMAKRAAASYAENARKKKRGLSSDKPEYLGYAETRECPSTDLTEPDYAETHKCSPEPALRPSDAALGVPTPESAYHSALRRWWALTAQGSTAPVAEAQNTHQEIIRLLDEVGEPRASALRRVWAREWFRETKRCPTCGEPGTFHEAPA